MSEAQQTDDHYATLGVTPRSEDVVIRAAYLALMRRYHPDTSSSPASSERARAIIAAFAVLGDVEKRLEYDWDRRRAAEELARPAQPRLTRRHWGLIAASIMLLLTVPLIFIQSPQTSADRPVRATAQPREATPVRPSAASPVAIPKPDRVTRPKAEMALVSAPEPDATVTPAAIEERGAAPRPKLDKSPLASARAPRAPLASLERPQARTEGKTATPAASAKTPSVSASAKCRSAKPGADAAICKNDNLAELDRLGAAFYEQSWRVGNAPTRAALLGSRHGFLGRREACRSDACLRSVYLTHMREISAIMQSKQPTRR